MFDSTLSLIQKIIKLQEAIDDATRRKIRFASLQGELLQSCLRKPTRKLWSRSRLRDGGHSSYVNCTK